MWPDDCLLFPSVFPSIVVLRKRHSFPPIISYWFLWFFLLHFWLFLLFKLWQNPSYFSEFPRQCFERFPSILLRRVPEPNSESGTVKRKERKRHWKVHHKKSATSSFYSNYRPGNCCFALTTITTTATATENSFSINVLFLSSRTDGKKQRW